MISTPEEQSKGAPGQLALAQALVNTQYGQGRHAHAELLRPDHLRVWLVRHRLLTDETSVTEGDFRRIVQLREALRSLLRANNGSEFLASQVEMLNQLASNTPLMVHFEHDGSSTLQADVTGVDGVIARLVGIVFTSMTDGTWARLKACRNDRCQKAFYDSSKNRSGAWCSMATCGSRLKARAYQHRRMAQREG
jgi:predicted RNA-binding Zn ribbon-like protein